MSELEGKPFNPYWPPNLIAAWKKANARTCWHCGKTIYMANPSGLSVYCSMECGTAGEFERKLP